VFAQHEPKAWIWSRGVGDFPPVPAKVAGIDKVVHLAGFELVMPLGSVYAGAEGS
jgi:hypothetical protein